MGANQSSQTEGRFDGRPAILHYKRGDSEDETVFSYTEGYKVHPTSQWTHIPVKSIIGGAPLHKEAADGDYHFLHVEDSPAAEQDKTASPVTFQSNTLGNPPDSLAHDLMLPDGASCSEFRQDSAALQPNFHVIVSTASGTGQAVAVYAKLVKPVLSYVKYEEGKDYVLHITSSETSIIELTRDVLLPQANLGIKQSIVLLSGDGGTLDIINTLLSGERGKNYKKPNVALVPVGTGNALAHSAGITADNTLGMRTWMRGTPKELPLFAATFSPGARILYDEARKERPLHNINGIPTAHSAVVCSWGFHAALVADSDTVEYRKFGVERFKMAAKEALFPSDGSQPHTYKGNVSIMRAGQSEWQQLRRGEHAYVLATPLSQLEKGFTISPDSRPLDGKLRLVHFGPLSGEAFMEIMGKAYQGGKHVEDESVGYEDIEGLRIEFAEEDPRWRRVCLDGQIIRVEEGGWVEVRAGQKGVVDLIVQ